MEIVYLLGSGILLVILIRAIAKSVTVSRMDRMENAHNGLVNQTKASFINAKNDIDALGKVLGVDFVKSSDSAALWDRLAQRLFNPAGYRFTMKEPNILQRLDAIEKHLGLTVAVEEVPAHTVVSWKSNKKVASKRAVKKVSSRRK